MRELVLDTFQQWLYLEDIAPFDVIIATALATFFPGDPLWLLVVGAPGSGKTEIVRSFNGDYVYALDSLTSKTLVSGLKDKKSNKHYGILPDLNGKLLVIKDLTVMLQYANVPRPEDNVFNQLRAAYDGEYAAAHGSGHKRQHFEAKFGLIAAVTPAVDRFRALNTSLGERFLTIRVSPDSTKAIAKAQYNCGKEVAMREDLGNIMRLAMEFYRDEGLKNGLPVLCPDNIGKIAALGDLTARLRSEVDRDRLRHITTLPQPEVGTRIVKQFTRLGELLSLYGAYDYKTLTRVARDCINPLRMKVLQEIYKEVSENSYQIHKNIEVSYSTVREVCDDLWVSGICEKKTKGRNEIYSFTPKMLDLIWNSDIFEV